MRRIFFLLPFIIWSANGSATSWAGYGKIFKTGNYASITFTFGYPSEENPDFQLPCASDRCYAGVGLFSTGFGGFVFPSRAPESTVFYSNKARLGVVRDALVRKLGVSGEVTVAAWTRWDMLPIVDWDTLCAGFLYWPEGAGWPSQIPGSVCGRISPPDVTCDAIPNLEFDYGTVSAADADGLRLTKDVRLSCSNVQSVHVRLVSPLTLSPTLAANFFVDGLVVDAIGVSIDVPSTGRNVSFSTRLTGTASGSTGWMSASSILILEFQ